MKIFTAAGGNVPTHVINTGGMARADELCFDPVHKVVMIANDAEPGAGTLFVTLISTVSYQILAKIVLPEATNGIEQCAYNPVTNQIYLNVPEVNGPGDDTVPGEVVVFSAGPRRVGYNKVPVLGDLRHNCLRWPARHGRQD